MAPRVYVPILSVFSMEPAHMKEKLPNGSKIICERFNLDIFADGWAI